LMCKCMDEIKSVIGEGLDDVPAKPQALRHKREISSRQKLLLHGE